MRISSSRVAVGAIAAALAFSTLQPLAGESRVVRSVPTFTVNIFAQGTSSLYNPDAVVVTSTNVFVAYQNNSDTVKGVPSYIVKYDRSGNMLGQVPLIGRCDGMRLNPYTDQLWALLNNDGRNGKPAASYDLGTIFSEAGQGAPVQGFIGALDPKTGILTPLLTARDGLIDPTTLIFVPAGM